jgi:hypothetical protein
VTSYEKSNYTMGIENHLAKLEVIKNKWK